VEPQGGFAVAGGGTGGHIFPALAVAAEIRRQAPGVPVYFLGKAGGMEEELAGREGLPFFGLPGAGLVRRFSTRNLAAAGKALTGFFRARRWLKARGIRGVLGTGGFVCGPVVAAARTLGIATLIHESNAVPGLTNRWLGRVATRVALGQKESAAHFPAGKTVVTGFPLRPGLEGPSRERGCAVFGLEAQRPVLFVFPGSLAARSINRAVAEMLPHLAKRLPAWQVLWMTGKDDFEFATRVQKQLSLPVVVREFVYEVPEAYAAADIVLARAGAGTLAELSAVGKPALLVPYPYATGNHQMYNAQLLERAGAARVVLDRELNGEVLLARLGEMIAGFEGLRQGAAAVQAAYPKQAARDLAAMLIALGRRD
jgi:UDP-N-acetylglucosamine--N-acetylmuramyl-(pentapeptide) pyrophosphoryl-undecaprenol N-acetylglucosamine transferase